MQVLRRQRPTPEQISVVRRIQSGVSLIRGAAGSGKTTTAIIALRAAAGAAVNQLRNDGGLPANILVLTFYNSLCGYISAVAQAELADYADDVRLYVMTFDKWAYDTLGWQGSLNLISAEMKLRKLAANFPRDINFVLDEVNYLLGRFPLGRLDEYIDVERTGRGASPQMPKNVRRKLLDEIVYPYLQWKIDSKVKDFHDLAMEMSTAEPAFKYDVIVIDEAQDFSANQLRAVLHHADDNATITVVTDSAQRIYPRGAAWAEAGLVVASSRSFRLSTNYRNTRQIASLAASLVKGLSVDDDGSLPDPGACTLNGCFPILIRGSFSEQLNFVFQRLAKIDLEQETVGFLHLKGGGWFDEVRKSLAARGFGYCELQGASDWPEGGSNIGLCTLHSAKGLEFDHVFMIGLKDTHASYGEGPEDDRYNMLRRLLAMGVGRARRSVVLGTKPEEALRVLEIVDPVVIEIVDL